MTAPSNRKVPIEQLLSAIEETLKLGPRFVDPLARELQYSVYALRRRLEQLESEQRAHRVRVKSERGQGMCERWHHGPTPGATLIPQIALGQELPPANQRVTTPFQAVVHSWPTFNGRDSLVIALFGPARKEAAWA